MTGVSAAAASVTILSATGVSITGVSAADISATSDADSVVCSDDRVFAKAAVGDAVAKGARDVTAGLSFWEPIA